MAHEVFISHSSKDKPVADAICAALEKHGTRCWIAPRDILPGIDWGAAIIDAITSSKVMVLVYSSHANASPQINREVERAVAKRVKLIPFRIEDAPMSKHLEYFISTAHWLDAMTGAREEHIERLCGTVRAQLARDSTVIPAPAPSRREPGARSGPARSGPSRGVLIGGAIAAAALAYFLLARKTPPPEIVAVNFPPEIRSGSRDAVGTVQFHAPRGNVQRAEFEVVSAERFEPFQVVPQIAGQQTGSFSFKLHSTVPQHVTLKATLVDGDGRRSPPVSFSFEVQKAASQARNPASGFEIQAPNGMRFKVPR